MQRREFLKAATATTAAGALASISNWSFADQGPRGPVVGTQQYPWSTFFRRQGRKWGEDLDRDLADVAASGIELFEPVFESADDVARYEPLLKKHGLSVKSFYVNSVLHEPRAAVRSVDAVAEIASAADTLGASIVVTNPSPIDWNGPQLKCDRQLTVQRDALDDLGKALSKSEMTLAYHNHDKELKAGAREFHHMLSATDPEYVAFCLDSHWIYRGCGDSQVALFDAVRLYGRRIAELHLRQSKRGIWTEAFSVDGDIDYRRLKTKLDDLNIDPLVILEQAVEKGSPETMDAVKAHRMGAEQCRSLFAAK
ncbi:sugar phosphate isomerase/epimerase family protein [Stratiformator vulcanicus]|uniref:Inosose dehydratase n=1 Tax=Stratiformator vulcanicus TaxID=2527980 RepID=A0A517QXT5_9PLAN|nr:sugar phosphate isomerase/epimerase [Stratiformator vulcanicus]QDT36462.1 Inosose dehydratase [Stratiformator vulcanicus]